MGWLVLAAIVLVDAVLWIVGIALCSWALLGVCIGVPLAIAMIWRRAARVIPLGGER